MNYADMTMREVSLLSGVHDLPVKARAYFARALIAEAKGETSEANDLLAQAVAFEEEARGQTR